MTNTGFEAFLRGVDTIHPLSDALRADLVSCLVREKFPRKTVLLKKGQTCQKIWFIEQGFARAFYQKEDKDITSWFMGEGDYIISVYSFFQQMPSHECIELLEASALISISYEKLQGIYRQHLEFNVIGRILTEKYYALSEERLLNMRMLTAQERYNSLLKLHASVFQRASLKQIASYLGITPETLSRLRALR